MQKDFDAWNKSKKKIHGSSGAPFYHEREIWWCAVGVNVGNEIDGTGKLYDRPVLVLRAFNTETFFGICLIGHRRTGKYYFSLGKVGDRDATANLSQIRLFDSKRLIRKIITVNEKTFQELAKELTTLLFPFLKL
jgi:mRNA interferase MazF